MPPELPPALPTIEECQDELHGCEWSVGDMAISTATGTVWMVFAHRGDERVVAKVPGQLAAWQEAVRMAATL
jgi:hypothetical protein